MRTVVLIVLALVITMLVVGIVFLLPRSSQSVTLPNGSRIELLGTTTGTSTFTTEKSWQKLARRYLPARMTKWIPPASTMGCFGETNGVTVYLRRIDRTPNVGNAGWDIYAPEDDAGFRFPSRSGGCSSGTGASRIYGLSLLAYPRRQPSFWLRFLDRNGVVLGSLRVPNPVRGPFAKWQSQLLPQTRTNGSVTLELQAMREDGDARWRYITPRWKLTASDPAWVNAKVQSTTFYDPTGNEGRRLSPGEPAWMARALVFRQRPEDFPDDEQLTITNLSIPAVGQFVPLDRTVELRGVKLTAHVLAGPGEFFITNGVARGMSSNQYVGHSMSSGNTITESWGEKSPCLYIESPRLQANEELLIRMYDDQNHDVRLPNAGWNAMQNGGQMHRCTFTPPPNAKSLNLKVMLNRPLQFEFLVNSADVKPIEP